MSVIAFNLNNSSVKPSKVSTESIKPHWPQGLLIPYVHSDRLTSRIARSLTILYQQPEGSFENVNVTMSLMETNSDFL